MADFVVKIVAFSPYYSRTKQHKRQLNDWDPTKYKGIEHNSFSLARDIKNVCYIQWIGTMYRCHFVEGKKLETFTVKCTNCSHAPWLLWEIKWNHYQIYCYFYLLEKKNTVFQSPYVYLPILSHRCQVDAALSYRVHCTVTSCILFLRDSSLH